MTIRISGVSLSDFEASTSEAMAIPTGNPLKHKGKLKQFLTQQLGLENEHQLAQVFGDHPVEISKDAASSSNVDKEQPYHYYTSTVFDYTYSESLADALLNLHKRTLKQNPSYNLSGQSIDVVVYRVQGDAKTSRYQIVDYKPSGVACDFLFKTSLTMPEYQRKSGMLVYGTPFIYDDKSYIFRDVSVTGTVIGKVGSYDWETEATINIDGDDLSEFISDDRRLEYPTDEDAYMKILYRYLEMFSMATETITEIKFS